MGPVAFCFTEKKRGGCKPICNLHLENFRTLLKFQGGKMLRPKPFVIIFLCFAIVLGLTGCGSRYFSSRDINPVLEDYVGTWPSREVGTLATKAGHRVNLVRMAEGKEVSDTYWLRGEFCNEPPPDVMESVAAAFGTRVSAALEATEPRTGITEKAAGELEFYRNLTTIMAPLIRRSQGLQWGRDALSHACNASLNRRISKENYLVLVNNILGRSENLIMAEINNLPRLDYSFSGSLPVPGQQSVEFLTKAAIAKCKQATDAINAEMTAKAQNETATKDKEEKEKAAAEGNKKAKTAEETFLKAKAAADAKPEDTNLAALANEAKVAMEEAGNEKEIKEKALVESDKRARAFGQLYAQAKTASERSAGECAIAKGQVALMAAEAEAAKRTIDAIGETPQTDGNLKTGGTPQAGGTPKTGGTPQAGGTSQTGGTPQAGGTTKQAE